ncbi:MAG: hypothetical protein QOJ58_3251, partial [Alphaproteobacteria bacterium]|nr:hypothetical protein [Alphaproteobacteria bacterium]
MSVYAKKSPPIGVMRTDTPFSYAAVAR